jgi:uroporphyrinogen III methyltransferase/synthase
MTMSSPPHPQTPDLGTVYLIGAGPGDPNLLTLRGQQLLGEADVVLYDYLANPQLLAHCGEKSKKICLGSHSKGRLWTQDQINQAMIDHAGQGLRVARLKGGDPSIFGCGFQELEALSAAGIPFEVIPGVSSGIAAAAYAGIPITHRDSASAVAFVTGQESRLKTDSIHDLPALARFPGTLIIYMGTTTVDRWSGGLIQYGKPRDTPVAIVRRCSHADQSVTLTTLAEVTERVRTVPPMRPPVVFIVGEVAQHTGRFNWFNRRPLSGKTILVTRPQAQTHDLESPLRELGAEVLCEPAIQISPVSSPDSLHQMLQQKNQFDWLIFSSSNGVREFIRNLQAAGSDLRWLASSRLAAIGPGTAAELQAFHLNADLIPSSFNAEGLLKELTDQAAGKSFLLLRASRGREVLAAGLEEAGGKVTQAVVYESVDLPNATPETLRRMNAGEIHWVTVTSSAIAKSLHQLYGEALSKAKLVSISPLTSSTLRELGYRVDAEATEATMPSLINAIQEAEGRAFP